VSNLLKAVVDDVAQVAGHSYGLIIHDEMTVAEMRDYVSSSNGTGYENSAGSAYDDGVMSLAIAVTVNSIEPPPPAYGLDEAIRAARLTAVEPQDGADATYALGERKEPAEAPWNEWGEAK
jgi:hypothetical protein